MKKKVTVKKMIVSPARYEKVKNQRGMQHIYITCKSFLYPHFLRFMYWPKEQLRIQLYLSPLSFWRRLWPGLVYIFTSRMIDKAFTDIVLKQEDAEKMKEFLLDYLATCEDRGETK